ncbi:ATP-binding cassette domain-containing protein [Streptomyces sp. NPDC057445]|uniref:ATP-binding cassette domain-containing protein n=1 Tax=Streptomyces sp. NPDC057445 TaxID=3346136 RepID=UPI0036A3B0FE
MLSRAGPFLARRRRVLLGLAGWSLLESVQTFLGGYGVAQALDRGFLAGRPGVGLAWLAVAAVAIVAGGTATDRVFRRLADLVEPLRDGLVRRVVTAALRTAVAGTGTHADRTALSRLTHQTESARDGFAGLVLVTRSFVFTSAGVLLGLAALAPALLLVVLPPLFLGLLLFLAALPPMAARQREFLRTDEDLAQRLGSLVPGLRDVVACGAGERTAEAAGELIDAQTRAARSLARWAAVRTLAVGVAGQSPVVLLLAAAPWLLGQGITAGALLGALTYLTQALLPALHTLMTGLGAAGTRLLVILDHLTADPAGRAGWAGRAEGGRADRLDPADRASRADLAVGADQADRTDPAHLADGAGRAERADLVDGADLGCRADRADCVGRVGPADRTDPVHLADGAGRAERADLVDGADFGCRADRADCVGRVGPADCTDPVHLADGAGRAERADLVDGADFGCRADRADCVGRVGPADRTDPAHLADGSGPAERADLGCRADRVGHSHLGRDAGRADTVGTREPAALLPAQARPPSNGTSPAPAGTAGTGAAAHREEAPPGGAVGPRVELRAVSFAYGPGARPVVDGLDLVVEPGGHLAVVGPSGIGKSTLFGLVAGLLVPDSGELRLGGSPVRRPDRHESAFSRVLIPQEAYVFSGSLRENLLYLSPGGAPSAAVDAAAEAVGLDSLVRRLGGPDEPVDPAVLSQGERQLVALTRAYLSPAGLVLLDEATCHLDPAAEARAERAFIERPGTLMVIAHRISSARRADRVLVLDGVRATCGRHEDLLDRSEMYRDLVGHWGSGRA